jgi:hypothetical protein
MNVIIGVNQGSYTVNANTRQITLSDLYFTPSIESLYVVLNITQDKMYYAAAQSYTKPVTITADGDNWILEYSSIFPILAAGDKLHIQFECCASNHICEENTTDTPLGAGATFTGGWQDCINYQEVNISVATDQNSATNGLVIEWSSDGSTVGDDDKFSVYANAGTNYTPNPAFRYVRVKYTNGATPQTVFHLMTILRTTMTGGSFHRIDSTLKDDSDARLSITIPKLKTAANTYVSQTATTAGNAKMSLEELESDVSTNGNTQLNVSPYIVDEYAYYTHILGDNIFKGAIIAIPPEHHEIHCGDSYESSYTGVLGNGASVTFSIVVPNEGLDESHPGDDQTKKQYHAKLTINTEAESLISEYEGATLSNNGTPITIFNRNRNSTNVDFLGFNITPTVTNTGTLIRQIRLGSAKTEGGMTGRTNEWILKDNTKYLVTILNATTSDNYYNIELDYYVHPGV